MWVASPGAESDRAAIQHSWRQIRSIDDFAEAGVSLHYSDKAPGRRLVVAPTGPVWRDGDDVRRFGEAAVAGVQRALQAGARRPTLVVDGVPGQPEFARAAEVAAIEAASAAWFPLEALGHEVPKPGLEEISVVGLDAAQAKLSEALEWGRTVARDVTGTEPEQMTPIHVAQYCTRLFENTAVDARVIEGQAELQSQYPLLYGVARASTAVPRHHPRVISLSYGEPSHPTFLLAGKGVTYDTGGADIKYGGAMAGMSRDKGGAGAVIGLFATLERLQPPGVRVVAQVGAVRNSVGADGFVSDEIITGHAGVRVRIGNTDAEGRLVLADLLSHLRTQAEQSPNTSAHLISVATLTGHVGRAYGPYTAAIDNASARRLGFAQRFQAAGELWGDPVEVSSMRREDFDVVRPRTIADDVLSSNTLPSTQTPRGHQFPAAFLSLASGIDRRRKGAIQLPYTHLDIGGSATQGGDWQHGRPTGSPILALAGALGISE